jgi:16S rRNA (guanine527-N7)-methyltransferase
MTPSHVSRETSERLELLKALVLEENQRQNLISASTVLSIEDRHVTDSLQLLAFIPSGPLLDIGSGGGFPGLVLACAGEGLVHLVEPRAKRAEFLRSAAQALGIADRVEVHVAKVERIALDQPVASITARAVASLAKLFEMASHLADKNTQWVLPKGQSASSELEEARRTWQGKFRLVPSITDDQAAIVVAEGVRRRSSR